MFCKIGATTEILNAANLTEIRHPLSDEERQLEKSILIAIGEQRNQFVGTQREGYDAMTTKTPLAPDITLEAVDQDLVQGWWVRPANTPADRVILFLHGGAYMLGSAKGYRGFASQIATRTGIATFVLDYPLAPEFPLPAAYDAAAVALRWLRTLGITQVSLVGDSAGGGLALASIGNSTGELPSISSVIVFSPWTDLSLSGASFSDPQTYDPVFQPQTVANAAAAYLGGADPRDGRASPLYAVPDVLPPLLIQVGTDELLLDDSQSYAREAAKRGGEVKIEIYEGLHHVFQRCVQNLPSARRAFDSAAQFLSTHWSSECPWCAFTKVPVELG